VVSKVTVLANHSADFIAHHNARAGVIEGNPLNVDMVYAAETAKLAFILNVVIDADKRIIKAFAGHPVRAHEQGCRFVLETASVKAVTADIVITSNGGYPLDQNLYQAVKGMTAAEATVKPGGVIIICAACNDGHGGEDFYRWFADAPGGAREVMDKILKIKPQETQPDQWEAQILARVQLKAHVIVVTDQCDHQMIRDMHMQAAQTLPEALAMAESILGPDSTVTVVPDGVSVIIVP
jgi:nickel-dependent lactate racemase